MLLNLVKVSTVSVFLLTTACGTEEVHYTDTTFLEHPPTLAVNKTAEEEAPQMDESVVSSSQNKIGMGDRVQLSDSMPPVITIKQPLAGAWNTVYQALKQKEIQITDHDKDKALYYVAFDTDGFLSKVGSFFESTDKQSIYLLALTEDGAETHVTVTLANKAEQNTLNNPSGENANEAAEHAGKLMKILYETMRDELVKK